MSRAKKELVIRSVDGVLGKKQVPLAVWCFLGNELELDDDVMAQMVFLERSHQEMAKLNMELNACIDHVFVPFMKRKLNARHGVSYSDSFWAVLLKPWMGMVVNTAFYYFLLLEAFLKRYKGEISVALTPKNVTWTCRDTHDFINDVFQKVDFHSYLVSEVIRGCYSDQFLQLDPVEIESDFYDQSQRIESVYDHRFRRCVEIPGMTSFQELLISLKLSCKKREVPEPLGAEFVVKPKTYCMEKPLIEAIKAILLATVPHSFGDNFHVFNKRALKKCYINGKKRVFGAISVNHEQMKFYLAHAKENGEILVTTQHGGNYGFHESHREPELFEYRFDQFISWGWEMEHQYKAKFVPLPSPYLRAYKDKHQFKTDGIVMVGTDLNPLLTSCVPSFHEGHKLMTYREDKLFFLQELPEYLREKVRYRGYPHTQSRFRDAETVSEFFGECQRIPGSGEDFHRELFSSQLAVLDHLGTTLLICLAANVPFVCFWSPAYCDLNDEGHDLVAMLKEENLYFEDPLDAADFVTSISHDIKGWWQKKQEIRGRLMHLYANTDPYFMKWLKTV